MKQAVAYMRVSTNAQAGEDAFGIDAQKEQEFYHENCDFVVYKSGNFDVDGILKRIEE